MAQRQRVFGLHAVAGLLGQRAGDVHALWVQDSRRDARLQAIVEQAQQAGVAVTVLPRRELDAMAPGARHQGVIAESSASALRGEGDLDVFLDGLESPPFLLILDGVQDPHNLGACLRTADAAGVHAVIVPRDKSADLTPAARKVASGAAETVPLFRITNLARTLRSLRDRGVWIYGADAAGDRTPYETDLRGALGLVLGAEGQGMRRLTREHCDGLLTLPMAGSVESLNVSVAAGILMYEAMRQRNGAK